MKKIFFGFMLIALAVFIFNFDTDSTRYPSAKWLLSETAFGTGDTVSTGYFATQGDQMELFAFGSGFDSSDVVVQVRYRIGTATYYGSVTNDTMNLVGNGNGSVYTWTKVLRGYGTSNVVNLIPGANFVDIEAWAPTGGDSASSYTWKLGVVYH